MLAEVAYADVGSIELIDRVQSYIINPIIELLFAVAFVVFLWGLVQFIAGQSSEDKVEEGKKHMFWGIVGFFIMVSVFGIVNLIINFLTGL